MNRSADAPVVKDIWDKLEIVGKIVAGVGIPVVLAVGGYFVQTSLTEIASRERRSDKIVEVASAVLSADQTSTANNEAIRAWAVSVINQYSEVPLNAEAIKELESTPLVPRREPTNRFEAFALEREATNSDDKAYYRKRRMELYAQRFQKQVEKLEALSGERDGRRYVLALFDAGLFAEFAHDLDQAREYYTIAIEHPLAEDPMSRTRIGRQIGEEARRHLHPIEQFLNEGRPIEEFQPTVP